MSKKTVMDMRSFKRVPVKAPKKEQKPKVDEPVVEADSEEKE